MADRISIDTRTLLDLSNMIRQIQSSLTNVHSDLRRSSVEVRRVASGQTGTIHRLEISDQQIQKLTERAGKLAAATQHAAGRWEETEKRISSQSLPALPDSVQNPSDGSSSGTSGGTSQGSWQSALVQYILQHFGILQTIKQNYDAASHQMDTAYRINQIQELIRHWISGEEYSDGTINELPGHVSYLDYFETEGALWNNDHVSLTYQEVEIFGHKMRILLPYINYGTGGSGTLWHGTTPGADGANGTSVYLDGSAGEVYVGSKTEIGFVDGKFVFHIGGGASFEGASGGVGYSDMYQDTTVTAGIGSYGADVQVDYRDGVLKVSGLLGLFVDVDADITVDFGKWFNDMWQTGEDISHGDFVSAGEKIWNLTASTHPSTGVVNYIFGNPITNIRSMLQ